MLRLVAVKTVVSQLKFPSLILDTEKMAASSKVPFPSRSATLPVYTPSDVARHCTTDDAWVSIRGRVLDVTPLLSEASGHGLLAAPLAAEAGKDISHWFDASGTGVRTHVDPVTNHVTPYHPQGRFVHVPPPTPVAPWAPETELPWWNDPAFVVGALTSRARRVRVINTLAGLEHELDVGSEQRLRDIADKFMEVNAHAHGYVWKALRESGVFETLDMDKTLAQNGVADNADELAALGIDAEAKDYLPVLALYFKDDLRAD